MAVALLEYKPQHYDTLPPVLEAARNAEPSGAIEALDAIGPVFVKHGVENSLGIILLHNHFELFPTEILVQFGNAAVPWNTEKNSADLKDVLPTIWRFVDEGLAPYEFAYTNPRKPQHVPRLSLETHGKFLAELRAILEERQLINVLGLCVLEDQDIHMPATIEIDSGRSSITLDVDIDGEPNGDHEYIKVIWQFGTKTGPSGEPVVFKKYKAKYELYGGAHTSRHLTTNK